MTADNRSVHTDALATLGTIIGEHESRDAIHLAVEPIEAGEKMKPGEHVYIRDGKAYGSTGATDQVLLGIVDPFLAGPVKNGQRFWLIVYPRTITSLRHVWAHPAFGEPAAYVSDEKKDASEKWLRDFCAKADCPGYEAVMQAVEGYFESDDGYGGGYIDGEYMHFKGSDAHGEIPPEFWTHYEVVTGKKPRHTPEWFSCSC